MIKRKSLLKLATVVSSVMLVSAFISYRAGALDGLLGNSQRPEQMSSSKSKVLVEHPTTNAPDAQPSSGDGQPAPATPPENAPSPAARPNGPTAILPGSKSGVVTAPSPSGI